MQDGMIAETRTHSSTDTTTHLKGNSFDHNASQLPTERISSPTSSPHPLSDMSSSRKRNTRADEDPFSADESAPIIRHAQGGAQDYNSISPSIPARTSGVENGASSSPVRRTREVENREQRAEAERHAAAQEIKEDSKWRKLLDKYGSVELENKGSVARDHLALGTYVYMTCQPSHISPTRLHILLNSKSTSNASNADILIESHRTHLPRLAPYLPLLRLDRNSSHPALPSQHHDFKIQFRRRRDPASPP